LLAFSLKLKQESHQLAVSSPGKNPIPICRMDPTLRFRRSLRRFRKGKAEGTEDNKTINNNKTKKNKT
jgi:hypothetical protein